MDNETLTAAERIARAEFRNSRQQPADWRRLANKLEAIVKAGGNPRLTKDVIEARRIADAVESLKPMSME